MYKLRDTYVVRWKLRGQGNWESKQFSDSGALMDFIVCLVPVSDRFTVIRKKPKFTLSE